MDDGILMSQFIDDELDLTEKIEFVGALKASPLFAAETLELLEQERLLHALVDDAGREGGRKSIIVPAHWRWRRPLPALAALAAVLLLCSLLVVRILEPGPTVAQAREYRFVLYQPSAAQVSVIGTFTDWSPVPLQEIGSSGYWALNLRIPPGEHRYSFLLDRDRQVADPTVSARERDDFGGENSILSLGDGYEQVSEPVS